MIAERLKCDHCKLVWIYFGYPAYRGCPRCGKVIHEEKKMESVCDCCGGTGKVMTNKVRVKEMDDVQTDNEAARVSREINRLGKYGTTKW